MKDFPFELHYLLFIYSPVHFQTSHKKDERCIIAIRYILNRHYFKNSDKALDVFDGKSVSITLTFFTPIALNQDDIVEDI